MLKDKMEDSIYDTTPYPSMTFPQTHPDRLASVGKFYHLETASPENCRVLELGCGDGTNLNWLAYSLPESEFIGVDLSKKHISDAQEAVSELGLKNVTFYQQDVLDIDPKIIGKFDYIIAHGLFSWTPELAREKILSLCRQLLKQNGIGYISYNTFPGCHRRRIAGDAMRFHTRKLSNPSEKVKEGVTFIKFLTENADDSSIYREILKHEFEGMLDSNESLIFHDDLEEENQPFYFSEFIELAHKHDLQFLSEVEKFTSQPRKLSLEVLQILEEISEDLIVYEQYIDFFLCCRFRQTLLCHKEILPGRKFKPEKITQFFISSNLHPVSENFELTSRKSEKFTSPKGSKVEINHNLTKAALFYLHTNGTHQIEFDKLIKKSREILEKKGFTYENWKKEADITASIFFQTYSADSIRFHLCKSRAINHISEKPEASKFARWQAKKSDIVTTFHGLNLTIDDFIRELLILLDGSRTHENLISDLIAKFYPEEQNKNKQEILEQISTQLEQGLKQMAKLGLLI